MVNIFVSGKIVRFLKDFYLFFGAVPIDFFCFIC